MPPPSGLARRHTSLCRDSAQGLLSSDVPFPHGPAARSFPPADRPVRQGAAGEPAAFGDELDEPPPEDFIQRLREELNATLASVQGAATLPWSNLELAMLGEMRFHSVAHWLPPAECQALRGAFAVEMTRLWQASAEG